MKFILYMNMEQSKITYSNCTSRRFKIKRRVKVVKIWQTIQWKQYCLARQMQICMSIQLSLIHFFEYIKMWMLIQLNKDKHINSLQPIYRESLRCINVYRTSVHWFFRQSITKGGKHWSAYWKERISRTIKWYFRCQKEFQRFFDQLWSHLYCSWNTLQFKLLIYYEYHMKQWLSLIFTKGISDKTIERTVWWDQQKIYE